MKSSLNYDEVSNLLKNNPSCINEVYNTLLNEINSTNDWKIPPQYVFILKTLIERYISFNDYLHSNNLLQIYKAILDKKNIPYYDWIEYYSLMIISKRFPKYFLKNASKFWDIVYSFKENEKYSIKINILLIDIFDNFKNSYVNNPNYFRNDIINFVKIYYEYSNKLDYYSNTINAHIEELNKLACALDIEEVNFIYDNLDSRNLIKEDINLNTDNNCVLNDCNANDILYYDSIFLDKNDKNKKILVIGDDHFTHNEQVIYGIGKKFNIDKNQFEILNDYKKIKNNGGNFVNKTQWNDDYIGIIFGSIPHSVSGKDDYSSLISKCQNEFGYPKVVVCYQNNNSGALKITKKTFKKALNDIIVNYKTKK